MHCVFFIFHPDLIINLTPCTKFIEHTEIVFDYKMTNFNAVTTSCTYTYLLHIYVQMSFIQFCFQGSNWKTLNWIEIAHENCSVCRIVAMLLTSFTPKSNTFNRSLLKNGFNACWRKQEVNSKFLLLPLLLLSN